MLAVQEGWQDGEDLGLGHRQAHCRRLDRQRKKSTRPKKILPAGALLWAWEADAEYEEEAGEEWLILLPQKWNRHVQYAWRFEV